MFHIPWPFCAANARGVRGDAVSFGNAKTRANVELLGAEGFVPSLHLLALPRVPGAERRARPTVSKPPRSRAEPGHRTVPASVSARRPRQTRGRGLGGRREAGGTQSSGLCRRWQSGVVSAGSSVRLPSLGAFCPQTSQGSCLVSWVLGVVKHPVPCDCSLEPHQINPRNTRASVEQLFLLLVRVTLRMCTDAPPVKPREPNASLDLNRSNFDNFYVLNWRSLQAAWPPRALRREAPAVCVSPPATPTSSSSCTVADGLCVGEGDTRGLSAPSEGAAGGIGVRSGAPRACPSSAWCGLSGSLSRAGRRHEGPRASPAHALLVVSSRGCPLPRPSLSQPRVPVPGPGRELSDALGCECRGGRRLTLTSSQPGPGQSGGCHGFDSAHDPAYITHPARRGRADPLHNGLAFFNVRASISRAPPCPVRWRKEKKKAAQNCPLSARLRPL